MTEDKNTTTILIIVGIAIGIIYLLSRNNKQPATLSSNSDLNSIGIGLNSLNQRMNLIEQRLDRLQSPNQQLYQQLSPGIPSPEMTYKNKMHIVRDANGDIVDIERDAKIIKR